MAPPVSSSGACVPGLVSARRGGFGPRLRIQVVAAHVGADLAAAGRRTVSIGGIAYVTKPARVLALVPRGYLPSSKDDASLAVWQWMLRKDALGQDCFLIGPPGPRRRRLALAWCELLGREVEFLSLSRDTTESDLKQRREISDGSLQWVDQPPVRAAREGRVLVLDGLEKAERNVLPTLNNLLENREMSLQDGTFLTSTDRFDTLRQSSSVASANLVRVHEDFRVVALGLPVPAFPGFPLDPPLRSRFQARHVDPPSLSALLTALEDASAGMPREIVQALVAFSDAISRMLQAGGQVPGPRPWPLPEGALASTCELLSRFPAENPGRLLHRAYPHSLLPPDADKACRDALEALSLRSGESPSPAAYILVAAEKVPDVLDKARVSFAVAVAAHGASTAAAAGGGERSEAFNGNVSLELITGGGVPSAAIPPPLVETPTHTMILTDAMQSLALGKNICFIGPGGEGKTALARRLAAMLGYPSPAIHTLHLYKDMTSRDLLQRRSTDQHGDTHWEPSPLLTAVLTGGFCVLDGLQRLRPDTIAALQTLCTDRYMDLSDGTRLCRHDRFEATRAAIGANVSSDRVSLGPGRWLRPVHRNFRVVALAHPPGMKPHEQWVSAEVLPLFDWLVVPPLNEEERANVLMARCPSPHLQVVLRLAARLRTSMPKGGEASHSGWALSLRQLLRLGRRASQHPASLAADVRRVALASFMPVATRSSFEAIVHQEIGDASDDMSEQAGIAVVVEAGVLDIGGSRLPISTGSDQRLVPKTTFFNIPRHLLRLREIMRDLSLGEKHLLLIGNQGTGKNKLVDNLLQLLRWEREYIQLHRDTTVSALTVQASLVEGKVVWEDSPLVQAVQNGRVLVVDEADKAPLEVVCILKGLVEDGEMTLADGRRILREDLAVSPSDGARTIVMHPDFKMFLLANRPGFPFQGNDLFRECGDVYAPHVIENPDLDSEVALLQAYAPNVDVSALRRLSSAFTELRQQVDDGLLTYPYSTRELVNVSRHLQRFPGQSIGVALRDILDFDRHDVHTLSTLREVLLRWGIPLDASDFAEGGGAVEVAAERTLPRGELVERWLLRRVDRVPSIAPLDLEVRNCTYMLDVRRNVKLEDVQGGRAMRFTEELWRFRLPLGTARYELEHVSEAVVLPGSAKLCALTERTATGALAIIVQDLSGGMAVSTCDRYESSFGLRSPLRKDVGVKIFALSGDTFGLAGERRIYKVRMGDEPLVTELTLPTSLFAGRSGAGEGSQTSDSYKPLQQVPRWNTDFAAEGAAVFWFMGGDAFAVIDALEQHARILRVPGVCAREVWALGPREFFFVGQGGELIHLVISKYASDVQLSEVLVEPVSGRPPLEPLRVLASNPGTLPVDACAAMAVKDSYCSVLVREARSAYARKAALEHYGKDAFAATIWPRPTSGSVPLHLTVLSANALLSAVQPADTASSAWVLEVMDLEKGALRVLEPARLGAPPSEDSGSPVESAEQATMLAPLVALASHGTQAVLVQRDGGVRIVEISTNELQEQQRQWRLMVGEKAADTLDLRIDGEEDYSEEEGASEGEEEEDMETQAAALRVAIGELENSWQGLSSALRAGATLSTSPQRSGGISGVGSAGDMDDATAAAQAVQNEIRAHVAATAIVGASRTALEHAMDPEAQMHLTPGVRQLLEKAISGFEPLVAEAKAAAAEHDLVSREVEQERIEDDTAGSGSAVDAGSSSSVAGQSRRRQKLGEAGARAAVARALAGALSGESVESRIRELAEALARKVSEAAGADSAAMARARLETAQTLAEAARVAMQRQKSGGGGRAGTGGEQVEGTASMRGAMPGSMQGGIAGGMRSGMQDGMKGSMLGGDLASDLDAAFAAVTQQLMNMEGAEQGLAEVLAQAGLQAGMSGGTGGMQASEASGGRMEGDMQGSRAGGGAGAAERSAIQQAASALLQAAQGVADGMAAARGQGQGRGQGRGAGRGRGRGRGRGGRGGRGTRGSAGPRGGKGSGRGAQLKSNQRGGYGDRQLAGEFSEEEEQRTLEKIKAKAKELAHRQEVKRSLENLGTDEYDKALLAVDRQIRELRVVMEQQDAKDREREWVAHQAMGELDDQRLVDGVTGEKLIYRRRIEPDVPLGQHQKKPKRLSFVMDVSASMYRFNGEDGRLDRMIQAVAMVMESLDGFEHKYEWNVVGHSGNGPEIIFVDYGQPPRGRVQRAHVVSQMSSASSIAASGDSTVEAIEAAVKRITSQEADDYLIFVVSDANLGGYGITPDMLRRALTADPKVTACAIFIAEEEAAEMLSTGLPSGCGYVCLDVSKLPNILKEIFARAATST